MVLHTVEVLQDVEVVKHEGVIFRELDVSIANPSTTLVHSRQGHEIDRVLIVLLEFLAGLMDCFTILIV